MVKSIVQRFGQSARRFLAWPGHERRGPASCAGGRERTPWRCRLVGVSRLCLQVLNVEHCDAAADQQRGKTGAACGVVSCGMLYEFYWEWWVGEKKKRASEAAGASSGGGQKRKFDGHVLCAPLAREFSR